MIGVRNQKKKHYNMQVPRPPIKLSQLVQAYAETKYVKSGGPSHSATVKGT